MNKRMISLLSVLLIIVMAGTLLSACGSSSPATSPSSSGGAPDGQTLLQNRCGVCHGVNRVTSRQGTADEWKMVVDRMVNNGAQLTPQEEQTLVTYLAQTYHP